MDSLIKANVAICRRPWHKEDGEWAGLFKAPNRMKAITTALASTLMPERLTSICDRLVLDSSERDDRHGALLDADMTADALILLERLLKHGESGAPRSWTST
jgi:hypothetical protein